MSIFHYRAEFIKQDDVNAFYRFYPDFLSLKEIFGEFRIDFESWTPTITSEIEIEDQNSKYHNEKPVYALTYKIKKYFDEHQRLPKEVFHIA